MFVFVVFSIMHDLTFYHIFINKKFSQKEEKNGHFNERTIVKYDHLKNVRMEKKRKRKTRKVKKL
jgi:hypothetical protein